MYLNKVPEFQQKTKDTLEQSFLILPSFVAFLELNVRMCLSYLTLQLALNCNNCI